MEEVLKRYPLVKNMLVPVSKLAEAKQKIAAGGNALHKFYADIASQAAVRPHVHQLFRFLRLRRVLGGLRRVLRPFLRRGGICAVQRGPGYHGERA